MEQEKEITPSLKSNENDISELPNPNAMKLKPLSLKWIIVGLLGITILVVGYSFNNYQNKIIQENKGWIEKNKETQKFHENFDSKSWNNAFKLRVSYQEKFNNLLNGYMASLTYSEQEKEKYHINLDYQAKVFQQAQQEFFTLKEKYAEYVEPDFSSLITDNAENFKQVNDDVKRYIEVMMPFWEYTFDKVSNNENAKYIYMDMLNSEMTEEEHNKACERLKEVPNLKYEELGCK